MLVRKADLLPIDFGGLAIFDYTAGQALSSSLALIEAPPGTSHPTAWSRISDKYYLVVEGEVEFAVEGTTSSLRAGDFCHVPQGSRFSYRNATTRPARLVLVHTPRFDLEAEVFAE